jgi:hypothetical protein
VAEGQVSSDNSNLSPLATPSKAEGGEATDERGRQAGATPATATEMADGVSKSNQI